MGLLGRFAGIQRAYRMLSYRTKHTKQKQNTNQEQPLNGIVA
jgi:hypothetical protein